MQPYPNILFIISDDHRHSAVHALAETSPTGDTAVRTPVLDELAARGVAFRRTHIMGSMTDAICAPSRAAILTGVNPLRATREYYISVKNGLMDLNPDLPILPEVFRNAGYNAYGIGKWHNDSASFNRGFADGAHIFLRGMSEHWNPPLFRYDASNAYGDDFAYEGDGFSSQLFADAAIDFLRSYTEGNPFFLYLSFTAPHDPRTAPADFAALYDAEDMPLPQNFMAEHPFDNGEMSVRDEELAPWPRTPDVIRQHIADYYAMITHMDHEIGRVLAALEESGQAEKTIVVYVADHGLAVGQHGLMGKQNLYEHSIRVPLILSGPGLPENRTIDTLHYSFDLFPSLCALAGVPAPNGIEGRNLLPLLEGKTLSDYDTLFILYDDIQRAVSDGEWKLIVYHYSEQRGAGTEHTQLFHLKTDPWEMRNLASDAHYADQLERLQAALKRWQQRIDDPLLTPGKI